MPCYSTTCYVDGWMSDFRESLKQSAVRRSEMERRFGFIPKSVLREISRGALSKSMYLYQQESPERSASGTKRMGQQSVGTALAEQRLQERQSFGVLGKVGQSGHGSAMASTMPAELVQFFIRYYAAPGQTYLDPFMGQGVQMQVAKRCGLHYYGYDLSTEFYRYIAAVRDRIDDGTTTLCITQGDSRYPDEVPDGIGDFSFHSPPYWDIEYYGDEPEQLGNGSYAEFLGGMESVARAWRPKFKAGAYHVVNVNDFRRDGCFYPYHADTITLFRRAGWTLVDTWIIEGLVGGLPKAFAVDFNTKRIAPKIHEYALVFRA